jgi:hypothetical protein
MLSFGFLGLPMRFKLLYNFGFKRISVEAVSKFSELSESGLVAKEAI